MGLIVYSTNKAREPRDIVPRNHTQKANATEHGVSPSPIAAGSSNGGTSYSSFKSAEDRAAFIKQQAEQRMAERLAALGLKPPPKAAKSAQQRQEQEERLHLAEAEDAKREEERQRRLAEEKPTPPTIVKPLSKKPPPPPSRGTRAGSLGQSNEAKRKADGEALNLKIGQEKKEAEIKEQQELQEARTKEIECVTNSTLE